MTSEPQQQTRTSRPTTGRPQQARSPQQRMAAARGGTDEFQRLMQRNTVDVRNASAGPRRRNPVVGKIALGIAVVCAAVDASAFAVFMGGEQQLAFGICFVVVFLTFIAAVLGFIAAVGSLGRWYGVFGVVIAFLANPVVLLVLLLFVAPEVVNDLGSGS